MIRFVKKLIGKSKTVRWLYFKFMFILQVFIHTLGDLKALRLFLLVLPYTMVGYPRIKNVYDLARKVSQRGLKGAFVECGVWKGGAAGVMGYVAEKEGKGRQIWLFDSFEGLPEPTKQDGDIAIRYSAGRSSGNLLSIGECVGELGDVQRLFLSVLGINGENIHIEQGWFQETLEKKRDALGPIAILRLDADWYESTKVALENLYDNVVAGGYVIIDDYGHWEGCKKAVDEFLSLRGIPVTLRRIDYTGYYFQKPL